MRTKKILITILSIITALCATLAVACNGNKEVKEPVPTASGWTYEYMSDIVIPVENIFDGVVERVTVEENKLCFEIKSGILLKEVIAWN